MEKVFKRSVALMAVLLICLSLLPCITIETRAATVDYVYSGKYIYNWGVREEVATFLSPNAIQFYKDNNTSLEKLMANAGSSTISSVPTSALYKALKNLMVSNHSKVTSYNDTRPLFQYTDCQNSGETSKKISSFYSGREIGPSWDSGKTWNREHVWPNSKGDLAGNGENDIMMLRPTSVSENSSRGNKAYGTTSSYYNPNSEAGGKYDLRGDVSRVILYQYVRWGCINTGSKYNSKDIFGTNGVIESLDVLLTWMEEDPVDTWELGRNDSVESITGTRNVFVDYPELAFALFGAEVPAGYTTPSGSTEGTGPVITVTANNSSWGTVTVDGKVITATPAKGYMLNGYTIVSGNATLSKSGNTYTVDTKNDVSIRINFAPIPTYTVTFMENGSKVSSKTVLVIRQPPRPTHRGTLQKGNTFVGWATKTVNEASNAPTTYKANASYQPQGDITLYAVYSFNDNGKTVYSTTFIVKNEDTSEPEVSEPEVSEPEVSEPEVSEPEVSEPEVSEPEVSEPEVSEPEVSEPEVSEPEVSTPEESMPETSVPEESENEVSDEASGEESDEADTSAPDASKDESKNEGGSSTDLSDSTENKPDETEEKGFAWYWIVIILAVVAIIVVAVIIASSKKDEKRANKK